MKPAKYLSTAFMSAATVGLLLSLAAPAAAADADQIARGAKAWADNCGRCHNLRSPDELDPTEWKVSVTHMRVRAKIPGNVADDIIAFLQASSGGAPYAAESAPVYRSARLSAGDPGHGEQVFMSTCVACHGADGRGAVEGVPNLASRLGQSDSVLLSHMINGFRRPGSPLEMPAKGGNPDLTDQEMADVLAYMRQEFGG